MRTHAKSLVKVIERHFGKDAELIGAEVGVWEGRLSADLLSSFPRLTLYMIDPWERLENPTMPVDHYEAVRARRCARCNTDPYSDRRVIINLTSLGAANRYGHLRFHFVFIDACHLYESVRDDIRAWWPLIGSNGILAGHDYNGVGDRRRGWGVKKAVDGFAAAIGKTVHVERGLVWWIAKEAEE